MIAHRSLPLISQPDSFIKLPLQPSDDVILCRDPDGKPTARFGDDTWYFTSYHLSLCRPAVIRFQLLVICLNGNNELVAEVKRLLFFLIYNSSEESLSFSTLLNYYKLLRQMAVFCNSFEANSHVGKLSIITLVTNKSFLRKFSELHVHRRNFKPRLKAFMTHVKNFPKGVVNEPLVNLKEINFELHPGNQVCVIPSRIYVLLMNSMSAELARVHENMTNLDRFIACFRDEAFGVGIKHQRGKHGLKYGEFRATFEEAVSLYKLDDLFTGYFEASNRRELIGAFVKMQFLVKNIIHFYTGMRHEEALRLKFGCVRIQETFPALVDDLGVSRSASKSIDIISTTTKLTKTLQLESWIATEEVVKAVEVAEKICTGLSALIDEPVIENSSYLFLSPNIFHDKSKGAKSIPYFSAFPFPVTTTEEFKITVEDIEELSVSDPGRDFLSDPKFSVGEFWKLTSHQYRRSLAYYASSSGFVSQPSLKRQFKHLCLLMSQYYSNNFENFKAVFGYFDEKRNESVLSGNHIAFEFQIGMSKDAAGQIMAYLLGDETVIHGGAVNLLEDQKDRHAQRGTNIMEMRSVTERAVRNGELAYRETLLGGCMKLGPCDNFMLGDVTSCISCESALIQSDKINNVTQILEKEISQYSLESGEYQICSEELEKLRKRAKKLIKVENLHE
ncbi:hypothetical protein [Cellvibrio sp. UBA7671]|uniref:hypothetical protein n=1 Tax=Cellvibrio sp. UBA7671 TaxID=1946312 RepID=UPI002F358E90